MGKCDSARFHRNNYLFTLVYIWWHFLTGWDHFDDSEVGFTELMQMYKLVTQDLKQEAIIVDADDLLQHPGKIR